MGMDHQIITNIVQEAFEKAKVEHAVHSRSALANHISDHSNLNYKTLLGLHKKYIQQNGSQRNPISSTIDELCSYLGFENYQEYVQKRGRGSKEARAPQSPSKRSIKWKHGVQLLVGTAIVALVFLAFDRVWPPESPEGCMAWADTLYIKVPCDTGPYSKSGTKVVPLDGMRLKNFRKTEVDMSTEFFSHQTGNPMIWYLITGGKIEFFTAPGLHPLSERTLKPITEYIIEKRVPIHKYRPDSFIGEL